VLHGCLEVSGRFAGAEIYCRIEGCDSLNLSGEKKFIVFATVLRPGLNGMSELSRDPPGRGKRVRAGRAPKKEFAAVSAGVSCSKYAQKTIFAAPNFFIE